MTPPCRVCVSLHPESHHRPIVIRVGSLAGRARVLHLTEAEARATRQLLDDALDPPAREVAA